MPFAATWMELETLIQSEVCQKEFHFIKRKKKCNSRVWDTCVNSQVNSEVTVVAQQ